MNNFKEVNIAEFQTKPFEIFGKDFMALCAGSEQNGCNAMTIAWGHLGSLWERGSHANRLPTVTCFVRPSRYTRKFMDNEPYFALCTFNSDDKKCSATSAVIPGATATNSKPPVSRRFSKTAPSIARKPKRSLSAANSTLPHYRKKTSLIRRS